MSLFLSLMLFACSEEEVLKDTASTDVSESEDTSDSTVEEDMSLCAEDYSFCGNVLIPEDLVGTTRAISIALYDTLEPAGPPAVTVAEIEDPEVNTGGSYEVEISPLVATGEYYIWVFLYMEGGGEWMPTSGIDYSGHSSEPYMFDGSPITFTDISLTLAP